MSTRGKLLLEPADFDEYRTVEARLGFVRCLAAMKLVEEGQTVYLRGKCELPRPYERMLERVALGLRTAPAPFIGNWVAPVLLVGDRPSFGKTGSLPNWPFISGIATGCSAWLAEKLEECGIPETALCWVNAYDRTGEKVDLSGIDGRFKQVIALGKEAHLALGEVPHLQTYHPQYWKRFHPKSPYYLMYQIKEGV